MRMRSNYSKKNLQCTIPPVCRSWSSFGSKFFNILITSNPVSECPCKIIFGTPSWWFNESPSKSLCKKNKVKIRRKKWMAEIKWKKWLFRLFFPCTHQFRGPARTIMQPPALSKRLPSKHYDHVIMLWLTFSLLNTTFLINSSSILCLICDLIKILI